MDLPVVNHEDYFAKIGDDHKFPIKKFGELASYLLKKKIVTKFYKPYPCSDNTLKRAHSETYIFNYHYFFLKIKHTPLLQYLFPVGCGPSSKI